MREAQRAADDRVADAEDDQSSSSGEFFTPVSSPTGAAVPLLPAPLEIQSLWHLHTSKAFDAIQQSLRDGVDPDSRDATGHTLLVVAAQNGNRRLVKLALRYGADINRQNDAGNTALHYCFAFRFYPLGEYLIGKGADDTLRNALGCTCYDGLTPAV
ncbi:Ankyrin repeat domain-containing protein [Plasmodiophora brassicae]|uniref:Uncharacterized protein n=1 Tax=Plasmodiophora brassicae TaxID=37360 RepID=A0A0G4J8E6_PLABS|nr:hypothetical protein PBRA_003505 [Plasmodiophora brassicae]SPQ99857.1 unnamed protein product [Plasmodiophora brassicae]